MRRGPLLLLLSMAGLVLVTAPAQACDLAEEPPSPARMYLYDTEADVVIREIDLQRRGLGAGCELVVRADLDGDRLVWVDDVRGETAGVYFQNLSLPFDPVLVREGDGYYIDLDLDHNDLYIFIRHDTGAPQGLGRTHHVFHIDLENRTEREVPVQVDWLGDPGIEGGILAWDWVSRNDYHHRLNVYDLKADAWVLQNVSYETIGMPATSRLVQSDEHHLLVTPQRDTTRPALYRLADGHLRPAPEDSHRATAVDAGYVYTTERDPDTYDALLVRRHIDGDDTPTTFTLPERLTQWPMVRDHVVTLGRYSLSDEERAARGGEHPPPWTRDGTPQVPPVTFGGGTSTESIPAASIPVLVALAFAAARVLRRAGQLTASA